MSVPNSNVIRWVIFVTFFTKCLCTSISTTTSPKNDSKAVTECHRSIPNTCVRDTAPDMTDIERLPFFLGRVLSPQRGKPCSFEHVVVISDQMFPEVDSVLRRLTLPVQSVDLDMKPTEEEVKEIFRDSYEKQRRVNYILMTFNARLVLEVASQSYVARGEHFLFSNEAKFLVLWHDDAVDDFSNDTMNDFSNDAMNDLFNDGNLTSSLLDNVAVVRYERPAMSVVSVWTLMWRDGGRREMDQLQVTSVRTFCSFFPNTRLGLNNRKLTCLTKDWLFNVARERDPGTGRMAYVGFDIELLHLLSACMNFTYELVPSPERENPMTWLEVSEAIASYKVDFGLPLWPASSRFFANHSLSKAVFVSAVSFAYIPTPERSFRLFDYQPSFASLPVAAVLCITACGALLSALITGINVCLPTMPASKGSLREGKAELQHVRPGSPPEEQSAYPITATTTRSLWSCRLEDEPTSITSARFRCDNQRPTTEGRLAENDAETETAESTEAEAEKAQETKLCRSFKSTQRFFMSSILVMFSLLEFALTRTGKLHAHHNSARLLIWSWLTSMLFVGQIYVGFLTADKFTTEPVAELEDLLKSGYKLISFEDSFNLVSEVKSTFSFSRYLESTQEPYEFYSNVTEFAHKVRSGKYVAVLEHFQLEYLQESGMLPKMEFLKPNLFSEHGAIAVGTNSPLATLFSEKVDVLAESGLTYKLLRKWLLHKEKSNKRKNRVSKKQAVDLKDMNTTITFCCIGVCVAIAVLLGEIIATVCFHCLQCRGSKYTYRVTTDQNES